MDRTASLPDDALADILRRLPPCDLAASRCIRKAWRDVVDTRRLLLPHVLPHSVRGIFVNYVDYESPRFFARPSSTRPSIVGNLDFLPDNVDFQPIVDHCNGLLIYSSSRCQLFVVNPATRRWERLRLPCKDDPDQHDAYLAFDPAVSPHYEVLLLPRLPKKLQALTPRVPAPPRKPSELSPEEKSMEDPEVLIEWPPASWTLDVFSSGTGQWQERSFMREGAAAGTMADARRDPVRPTFWGPRWGYGVYWRGVLYVHCRGGCVIRLSLSDYKYQVLKAPVDTKGSKNLQPCLGKSEKGIYFTTIHDRYHLRVWILDESTSGEISWVLKHHIDTEPWATIYSFHQEKIDKTWLLYGDSKDEAGNNSIMPVSENLEWNSDDDNVVNIEDDYERWIGGMSVIGFHPYKEVLFLELSSFEGVAYHLNSSKVQYLGQLRPRDYYQGQSNGIYESFPYTPCLIGELSMHA